MKQKYLTNLIMESSHWISRMNSGIKNVCIIVLASVVIGTGIYGCKKEEPQQEEISTPVSIPLEEQTRDVPDQTESADKIQLDKGVELTKWAEGKSLADFIATALRAYTAENTSNGDYENITVQKLFATPEDLQGHFFNIEHITLSNVSFDETRTGNLLHYTITVNRPDESWKIKSFQLLHTRQWIQTP